MEEKLIKDFEEKKLQKYKELDNSKTQKELDDIEKEIRNLEKRYRLFEKSGDCDYLKLWFDPFVKTYEFSNTVDKIYDHPNYTSNKKCKFLKLGDKSPCMFKPTKNSSYCFVHNYLIKKSKARPCLNKFRNKGSFGSITYTQRIQKLKIAVYKV